MNDDYLSREQIEQILRPINPSRVSARDGMNYVEAYEVKAHMARVFGVCRWSSEVIEQHLICEDAVETRAGKPAWYVAYRSIVKVTVCSPNGTQLAVYTEGHAGDSTHPVKGEAHGNAITNSESYAFKRAACMALLDQGGLSLYGKGSKNALVIRTLVMPGEAKSDERSAAEAAEPVDSDVPAVVPESETVEVPPTETTERPAVTPPADEPVEDRQERADMIRQKLLDLDPKLGHQQRLRAIAALKIEAAKGKVLQVQVGDLNGEYVIGLNELLDAALRIKGAA